MARFTGVKKVRAWSSKSRQAAANGGECPFDDAAFWEDDKSMSFHVLDELELHPIACTDGQKFIHPALNSSETSYPRHRNCVRTCCHWPLTLIVTG
ncbi:hypothetical protein SAMN05519103_09338 [Rhizobiales bacterium GAS113]|nr:hypothetical protein SAMN05519103_09338 [Rhizobiales bacterium GAS113]